MAAFYFGSDEPINDETGEPYTRAELIEIGRAEREQAERESAEIERRAVPGVILHETLGAMIRWGKWSGRAFLIIRDWRVPGDLRGLGAATIAALTAECSDRQADAMYRGDFTAVGKWANRERVIVSEYLRMVCFGEEQSAAAASMMAVWFADLRDAIDRGE